MLTKPARPGSDGARYRVRTCEVEAPHEALATSPIQIATQNSRRSSELGEITSAWAELPDVLRAAILAIVRSCRLGRTDDRRGRAESGDVIRLSRPARLKGDKRNASAGRKTTKRSAEDVRPEPRGPRGRGGERPLRDKTLRRSNSAGRKNKHRKQKENKMQAKAQIISERNESYTGKRGKVDQTILSCLDVDGTASVHQHVRLRVQRGRSETTRRQAGRKNRPPWNHQFRTGIRAAGYEPRGRS